MYAIKPTYIRFLKACDNVAIFSISQVYSMGPVSSRPFTMLVHCTVSAGFLMGSLIVRPFLPEKLDEAEAKIVCEGMLHPTQNLTPTKSYPNMILSGIVANSTSEANHIEYIGGIAAVFWPHLITAIGIVATSMAFLCLPTKGSTFQMPIFSENKKTGPSETEYGEEQTGEGGNVDLKYKIFFVSLVFTFYFISCAIERIFQVS